MHLNSELLFRECVTRVFASGLVVLERGIYGYPSYYQKILDMPDIKWILWTLVRVVFGELKIIRYTLRATPNIIIQCLMTCLMW